MSYVVGYWSNVIIMTHNVMLLLSFPQESTMYQIMSCQAFRWMALPNVQFPDKYTMPLHIYTKALFTYCHKSATIMYRAH